jgi:EmrB/QacA subfamily drug resistance transporter
MVKPIIAEHNSGERAPSVRWAILSLSLSMLLSSLGTSIANVALPTFAQAFDASFQDVQWIVLAYLLAVTTLIVSVGRLGDIIGRRRLLLAGILLFTLASVLCGVAPTLGLLIAARVAQGLGAAVMMALTMAFVGDTVPKARTGRAMGLLGTMSAIGTALGPSLGGVLIAGSGWRAIFLVNVPVGIVIFLLAHRHLPVPAPRPIERENPKCAGAGFDIVGTLLLAATLAAYALAMTMGRGRSGPLTMALLLAAVVGAGLFVRTQAMAKSPLIPLAMLRDGVLSASLAMSTLVATVMMATLVVGPFYLSRGLGLDAALVGLTMSAGPMVAALTGVPAGRMTDRLGAGRVTVVGLVAMAAGSFILATLPATFGIPGYIAPMVVVTTGYALFQTANNTAVMTNIRPDQRGVVSGMLNVSRNLGLITGACVMGAVFALASATGDMATAPPEAVAGGMRMTFAVAAMLMVAAIALAMATGTSRRTGRARGPASEAVRPDCSNKSARHGWRHRHIALWRPVDPQSPGNPPGFWSRRSSRH